ncbi:radical SAM protein [Candidatus Woesearchaeota archaeon]|nr:radical SAM protein [Candidatus Woesearchaeota archaeon]
MELKLKQFTFSEHDDFVRVYFLKIFYFDVNKEEFFERLDVTKIESDLLETNLDEETALENFEEIFSENIYNLTNKITQKHTYYITEESNIPLIGTNVFGIVDRNSNIIEVKPVTGCNLKCIYCSLSERGDDIENDFVIDADYLFNELEKVIKYKLESNPNINFEVHIGTHGEPLLYYDLEYFLQKVRTIKQVNRVSINTNATLLDEKYIIQLVKAGLNRFNISINSIDQENAKLISGTNFYSTKKSMENIEFIDSLIKSGKFSDLEMTLAPVLLKGINVDDIDNILTWAVEKDLSCRYGIQNFLLYKTGRRPTKMLDYKKFFAILSEWQDKHKVKLILDKDDFNIEKTLELPKVLKKDDTVFVDILFPGRRKGEYIAKYNDRIVTVTATEALKEKVLVKITRTKHNIYDGTHIKKNKKQNCKRCKI